MIEFHCPTEADTRAVGAWLAERTRAGDIVLLEGVLGAGKTTLIRGFLESLGYHDHVRSPTFNLVQVFDTEPPVVHADLYRVSTWHGLGLEDYLDTHISLIEWPKGLERLDAWHITIHFEGEGRLIQIAAPKRAEIG